MAFASTIPCFSPLPPPKHSNSPLRRSQFSTSRQMCSSSHRSWSSSKQPQHREMAMPVRPLGPRTLFLQAGFKDGRLHRRIQAKSMNTDTGGTSSIGFGVVVGVLHLVVSLGVILAMDKLLKQAFVAAAIKFPSALFGMFCIFSVLLILDSTIPSAATGFMNFFEPAALFIQRWLPLFYVPSLVVLPLAVRDIPAASGLKICVILVGGWLASLSVAGYTAVTVRKIVKTEMVAAEPMKKPSPFSSVEVWSWTAVFALSFSLALLIPTALGTSARTRLPFLLAATVLGYMVGSGFPSGVKRVFHPIICCALSADLAALAFGYLSQSGMNSVLGDYLTKASSNPGAGDILMGFLGSVIISFAFSMFKQRKLVKRHAAEIFSSVIISTIFSLYSTAMIGRAIGLESSLTISILPRCITVALALSIVSFFEGANPSLTAAVVVLTGLVGANFVQAMLDRLGLFDPIARGIATASRHKWMRKVSQVLETGIFHQGANVSSVLKPISNAGVCGGAIFDDSSGVSEYQSTFLKMNAFPDRNSMTSEAAELTNWVNQKNYLSETKASPNQMEAIETDLADIHMVLGASVDATQNGEFEAKPAELKKQQPSAKKSNQQFASKVLRPKQSKKNSSPLTKRQGSSVASVKLGKKNVNAVVNGTRLDMSRVPSPICSCTGVPRRCYRWGAGGWQSSCCTLSISEYPLPMSPSRPTARMAGRKMSSGAYSKLLERLETEGYSLSNPVDLKDHWARHGTNKYATIK